MGRQFSKTQKKIFVKLRFELAHLKIHLLVDRLKHRRIKLKKKQNIFNPTAMMTMMIGVTKKNMKERKRLKTSHQRKQRRNLPRK